MITFYLLLRKIYDKKKKKIYNLSYFGISGSTASSAIAFSNSVSCFSCTAR